MSSCRSLFDMQTILTGNHIHVMLDLVGPLHRQLAFDGALDALRRRGGLVPFPRLGGRVQAVPDGTEYVCS